MTRSIVSGALAGALLLLASVAGQAEARSAAVLATTLIDSSTEGDYFGAREDEAARVRMMTQRLAEAFAARGWEIVDTAPAAGTIERMMNPSRCNSCDAKIARGLGADVAVTAEVQKVSNLILTINVYVRDAESGELLRLGNADIRSNTDASWRRGLDYVLENRIFPVPDAPG